MRSKLTASEAFQVIINRANIPPLNGKTHAEYLERFAYMVTRDALFLYGCEFKDCEWMAAHSKGSAGRRFDKCIRDLRR